MSSKHHASHEVWRVQAQRGSCPLGIRTDQEKSSVAALIGPSGRGTGFRGLGV